MKRIWNWIWGNDYYPIWAISGNWAITFGYTIEILYSPSRDDYKLNCYGSDPKVSPEYAMAVKKLNEFKSKK